MYCKLRSMSSLGNEYGFMNDHGYEVVNYPFFVEKKFVEECMGKVFKDKEIFFIGKIIDNGYESEIVSLYIEDLGYYNFSCDMLVNNKVTDGVVFDDVV